MRDKEKNISEKRRWKNMDHDAEEDEEGEREMGEHSLTTFLTKRKILSKDQVRLCLVRESIAAGQSI